MSDLYTEFFRLKEENAALRAKLEELEKSNSTVSAKLLADHNKHFR